LANIDRSLEALRQCSEQFDKHGIREPGSADAGAEVFARVERVCRARSASSADYSSTVAVETEALHFLSLRRTEEELVDMAWLYILDAVPGAVSDEASRRQRLVKRMTVHSIRWGAVSEDRSGDDWSGGLPTPLEKLLNRWTGERTEDEPSSRLCCLWDDAMRAAPDGDDGIAGLFTLRSSKSAAAYGEHLQVLHDWWSAGGPALDA
jgi:hypothetical protein